MPGRLQSVAMASPPNMEAILAPILPALPAAAVSTTPPTAILPLLSPILRQRVQLLSTASTEPWIRLLSYDVAVAPRLAQAVSGGMLEPHPISGEVEVDWDGGCETRYKRLDEETLQSLVVLKEIGLVFRLVYCVGDQEGGGDGWRIGEVGVPETPAPFASFGGSATLPEAETTFESARKPLSQLSSGKVNGVNGNHTSQPHHQEATVTEDDDDDDYWARYDATPARTPGMKRSPAPASLKSTQPSFTRTASAEDAYFAQYDSVQPAMDNHDPDEAHAQGETQTQTISQPEPIHPPTSNGHPFSSTVSIMDNSESPDPPPYAVANPEEILRNSDNGLDHGDAAAQSHLASLLHPRPASSASSAGSQTVAKLEDVADKQEQSEFGVKQHVSRTIRSLFLLSRASGIDREEFERIVKTELDCLALMGD
jgi:hypothetical protein